MIKLNSKNIKFTRNISHTNMIYEYPKHFARFYDLIYHEQRDGVDNEYFQEEIGKIKGKILEIGVGTGRLFLRSMNQGADIYGIDISRAMLDVLYKKIGKDSRERISLQNMVDFKFDFKFDLIIAPFRVMMHLLDKNEQFQAIQNVHKHLNKGGSFIFDVFVPDLNQLIKGLKNHVDFEGEYNPGRKMKRYVTTSPDLINQIIQVTFRLEWFESVGSKSYEWTVPLRYFFRYELEHLIERSDFKDYQIYGDYHRNTLNQNSKEFIVVCKKG